MAIIIGEERLETLTAQLQGYFREQFDAELSDFRAKQVVEFFLTALGPQVYNQAVQDARRFMQQKLDDLDGEVYQPEGR